MAHIFEFDSDNIVLISIGNRAQQQQRFFFKSFACPFPSRPETVGFSNKDSSVYFKTARYNPSIRAFELTMLLLRGFIPSFVYLGMSMRKII